MKKTKTLILSVEQYILLQEIHAITGFSENISKLLSELFRKYADSKEIPEGEVVSIEIAFADIEGFLNELNAAKLNDDKKSLVLEIESMLTTEIKITKTEMELFLCMFMRYSFSPEIDAKLDEISVVIPSEFPDEFVLAIKGAEINQVLDTLDQAISDSDDFGNEILEFIEKLKQKFSENPKEESITLTAKEMTMLLEISTYYDLSDNIDDQLDEIGEKFSAGIAEETEDFVLRIDNDEPQDIEDSLDDIITEEKIRKFAMKLKAEIEGKGSD
jgi:hypothetical protein